MYQPVILPYFRKQAKKYVKKYPELKLALIRELDTFQPTNAVSLGKHVYKVRFTLKTITKGKSGGFRLLLLVVYTKEEQLVPITLYYKGDRETVSNKELNDHLTRIEDELKKISQD